MKWYDNLYVGESIKGKERRIRRRIERRALTVSIYVIAFASNPDNLLDMIPARDLLQRAYPKDNLKIIGLAKGYEEGLDVITRIIDETYQATGGVDVYSYLKEIRGSGA